MSQKEKEMKQGAAEAENENLEAEHAEAENGETSADLIAKTLEHADVCDTLIEGVGGADVRIVIPAAV